MSSTCNSLNTRLEVDILLWRVSNQIRCQQQERKPKAIVGTSFRRNDLSQGTWNVLVGKRSLGDGLGENRISRSNQRGYHHRSERSKLRYHKLDAACSA
jgi:hypothetical protein